MLAIKGVTPMKTEHEQKIEISNNYTLPKITPN